MVDAPGRRNDAAGRCAHPPTTAPRAGRTGHGSGRSYVPTGLTRSASRRVGAELATDGTLNCVPNGDGGGTLVPVADGPTPPPPTGDGAAAAWLVAATWLATGTGMFRI